jgi:hypothetical protein
MLLALLPFGQACQHAERDEPPAPTRPAQPGAGGPQLSQEPYLTLAQIAQTPNASLIPVPAGYELKKAGLWSYSAAYLLVGSGAPDGLAEVYVFNDPIMYEVAVCNLKWIEDRDKDTNELLGVGCADGGSSCSRNGNCLIKCTPA